MQLFEQWVFDKEPTVCQAAFYALEKAGNKIELTKLTIYSAIYLNTL